MSRKQGVVTGFVKEVDPAQGRVKVTYDAIDEKLESAWAYVSSAMAGKGRGALFMPEPGDEVLVAFGDNDFDTPFVLGFLWNGQQVSPETKASNRVIVTPGGHQLRFEDESGNARVVLESSGGHRITLDDEARKLEIKSNQHRIVLDDVAGDIAIEAGPGGLASVRVQAVPPIVTVSSGTTTVAAGPAGLSITAAGPVSLTAPLVTVNTPFASFAGVLQCGALVTNAVASTTYTPGIGNLI